jgi:hypothetical protein
MTTDHELQTRCAFSHKNSVEDEVCVVPILSFASRTCAGSRRHQSAAAKTASRLQRNNRTAAPPEVSPADRVAAGRTNRLTPRRL